MEYQKISRFNNTLNQPYKFRTVNWVEVNDESRGKYKKDNQIRFETSMLRSNLWDYNDAYILKSRTITITGEGVMMQQND